MTHPERITLPPGLEPYWPRDEDLVKGTEGIYRTPINGVLFLANRVFEDPRGSFLMSARTTQLEKALGREVNIVQTNLSYSREGVIRGIHAELQDKIVTVAAGLGLAVLVDLRKDSPSYCQKVAILLGDGVDYGLSQKTRGSIFIDGSGIGNSFMALKAGTSEGFMVYSYGVSEPYEKLCPGEQLPVYFNDPTLEIPWPTSYKAEQLVQLGLISKRDLPIEEGGTALNLKRFEELRRLVQLKNYFHKHPIILVGGTGTVGKGIEGKIANVLGKKAVITASRNSAEMTVDVLDQKSIATMMLSNPGIIFNLAASTNVNRYERDTDYREMAKKVSLDGMRNLLAEAGNTPIALISTDFVFSGDLGRPAKEEDLPDPKSSYGQIKRDAEKILLSSNGNFVIRISYPWYPVSEHLKDPQLIDSLWWMLTTIIKGQEVPAFDNVKGSWTDMNFWGEQLLPLTTKASINNIRIIHAGGEETSPYEIAKTIKELIEPWAQKRGIVLGEVKPVCFQAEEGKTAPRPNHSLNVDLARKLGFQQPDILQTIRNKQWLTEEVFEKICQLLA